MGGHIRIKCANAFIEVDSRLVLNLPWFWRDSPTSSYTKDFFERLFSVLKGKVPGSFHTQDEQFIRSVTGDDVCLFHSIFDTYLSKLGTERSAYSLPASPGSDSADSSDSEEDCTDRRSTYFSALRAREELRKLRALIEGKGPKSSSTHPSKTEDRETCAQSSDDHKESTQEYDGPDSNVQSSEREQPSDEQIAQEEALRFFRNFKWL